MCDTAVPPQYPICETDNGGHKKCIILPKKNSLTTLEGRLETFKTWPNKEVDPRKLAEAGFYYTKHEDIVRCPFCFVEGYRWQAEDNPMDDHLRWTREQRRQCTFVSDRRSEHDDAVSEDSTNGRDTCGKYGVEILPCSIPEDKNVNLEKLGVTKVKGPAHPEYVLQQSRLESFKQWPKSLRQKPEDLASAGFFYLGCGDQVLCFHCGGGLKDWEENDEPWEQHGMWFPKCSYLLLKKGVEYVNKLKEETRETEDITLPSTSGSLNTVETKVPQSTTVSEIKSDSDKNNEKSSEQDHHLCKICFKNELGVVFLPCGHIVACVDCASALSTCAVCRKPLEATVRAFLS
ncbi:unnamed protein product [Brassicogethes aeneus]|uniref:RING-type domain-containing protein n=1 Tax=Brassicogethes aeneus TaxID=1431903 RepID=A0A9P0FGF3_BRAAE|nr:unnamed protein product [Brassicogethes aeneus]